MPNSSPIGNALRFSWAKLSFTLVILFTLVQGCFNAPETTLNDIKIQHIITPLSMDGQSLTIDLHDLIGPEVILDSVRSKDLSIEWNKNSNTLILNSKASALSLATIELFQKDIRYCVPVFCGNESSTAPIDNKWNFEIPNNESIVFNIEDVDSPLALWNNLQLQLERSDSGYLAMIPPFAKYFDHSHVVIYGINSDTTILYRVVPLRKGKVVSKMNELRMDMVEQGLYLNYTSLMSKLEDQRALMMMDEFMAEQLEQPSSLELIYGANSTILKTDSTFAFEMEYLNEKSVIIINSGSDTLSQKVKNGTYSVNPFSIEHFRL